MKTNKKAIGCFLAVFMLLAVSLASASAYTVRLSENKDIINPEYQLSSTQGDKIQKMEIIDWFDSPGDNPYGLAWDGNYLWHADSTYSGKIYKIDPSDGSVVYSFGSPAYCPAGLTWDGNYLWMSVTCNLRKIYKIDPSDGSVVYSFNSPGDAPFGLTWDGNYLWVSHACNDPCEDKIYKIDPSDGSVVYSFNSPGSLPTGLAWDGTYLWNADWCQKKIYKIDPSDGSVVDSIDSPEYCSAGLTWDGNYLWNANYCQKKIYKLSVNGGAGNDDPPTAWYDWEDADGDGTGTVINFDASDSTDDKGIVSYEWDWTSNGTYDETGKTISHDYGDDNYYDCTLRVTDTIGQTDTDTKKVHAGTEEILLTEGFEDGVMPPPGGWTVDNENMDRPWSIAELEQDPEFVHSGNYGACIGWEEDNPSDNWLVSPNLDLSGYPGVTLTFWANSSTKYPGATMELHIMGNGFDDVIWDMIEDENWPNWEYRKMTFDLGSYIGKTIKMAWRYVGIDGDGFALDDIIVTDPEDDGVNQQQQNLQGFQRSTLASLFQQSMQSIGNFICYGLHNNI